MNFLRRIVSGAGELVTRLAEPLAAVIDTAAFAFLNGAVNAVLPGAGTALYLGLQALAPEGLGSLVTGAVGDLAQRGADALYREAIDLAQGGIDTVYRGADSLVPERINALPEIAVIPSNIEPMAGGIISAINSLIPGGIANLFNLGLGIGAILALGTMIYAGILYSISGDNASQQKEAKAWMWAAIKGLALLAFGVVLINIINPGLIG